jgi:hypothetical protein
MNRIPIRSESTSGASAFFHSGSSNLILRSRINFLSVFSFCFRSGYIHSLPAIVIPSKWLDQMLSTSEVKQDLHSIALSVSRPAKGLGDALKPISIDFNRFQSIFELFRWPDYSEVFNGQSSLVEASRDSGRTTNPIEQVPV